MTVLPGDSRVQNVGFCKLIGDGIEHFAQKYEIQIGRKSKSTALDVAIGDNMNISRQHATIVYSFEKKAWELRVLGKNGVTVRDTLYTPSSPPVTLQSGDLLQLGDRAFFFLLEKGSRMRHKSKKRNRSLQGSVSKQPASKPVPATLPTTHGHQQIQLPADGAVPQQWLFPTQGGAAPAEHQQQQPANLPLPFLYRHFGAAGIPLANSGAGASQPAPLQFSTNTALQHMGVQVMLKQQLSQAHQAHRSETAVASRDLPTVSGAAGQVSPLLQQLMAANTPASGPNQAPAASLMRLPQVDQSKVTPLDPLVQRPVHVHSSAPQEGVQAIPPKSQPSSIHLTYPEGFPAQLLQGLQHHQHLQQQAQAQAATAQIPPHEGSTPPQQLLEETSHHGA